MKNTEKIRQLIEEETLLVTAGAHDALSARIIEKAGFKAVFLSGFGFEARCWVNPMWAC